MHNITAQQEASNSVALGLYKSAILGKILDKR